MIDHPPPPPPHPEVTLSSNQHPAIARAIETAYLEELEHDARASDSWRANNRLWKAVMLSPTLEICQAMLRGQQVPVEKLDPEWVRRFGMRKEA